MDVIINITLSKEVRTMLLTQTPCQMDDGLGNVNFERTPSKDFRSFKQRCPKLCLSPELNSIYKRKTKLIAINEAWP
jgi:hypothetical protein